MSKEASEFQQGVLAAEKIWMQAIPELLRQGTEEASYLECGICAARYHLPKEPIPASQKVFCPRCLRYDDTRVGICKVVKRTVGITTMAWQRETRHATAVIDTARRLIWFLRSAPAATLDPADLNNTIGLLEADCNQYDAQRKLGWDHQTYQALPLEDLRKGMIRPVPLQSQVSLTKEDEWPTPDGS